MCITVHGIFVKSSLTVLGLEPQLVTDCNCHSKDTHSEQTSSTPQMVLLYTILEE